MTNEEVVQALRCCAKRIGHDDACENCKVGEIQDRREYTEFAAANVIERLTAENAKAEAERDALLDIAKNGKDCDTCKHCEVCVQPGIDIAHWCDRCVEKCPCHGCGGDHWEWRGLPEAPAEGEKA